MNQDLDLTTTTQEEEQGGLIQIVQLPIIKERLHFLKGYVDQQVSDAMAMVCTEDTVIYVKQIRAELNALFTEAENQRKAVKAAVMQPYLDFEAVYKECISAPFKRADDDLRLKIVAVETGLKKECENRLRQFFNELTQVNGLEWLRFEQAGISISMADAKAKTQPPKRLREQLENFVNRVAKDVDMILTLKNSGEILAGYKEALNVTDAIQSVEERRRQIERAEEEKALRDAVRAQETEARRKVEAFAPATVEESPAVQENLLTCTFTVTDTRDRLKLLKQFLDANGYKYTS